jgi:hypothetical protein
MAKLIGNYTIAGQKPATPADPAGTTKAETSASEFERRAMERLGGSIAFVMKGKTVVWSGGPDRPAEGRNTHEDKPLP